jgi:hypothetical protein
MSDPIDFKSLVDFKSLASGYPTCDIASGDIAAAPIQGETSVCQADGWQACGWLPQVPFDGPYGVCTLPADAALKEGAVSVCELESYPVPPVCDNAAAAADAAKARAIGLGETRKCPANRDMPPGPSEWQNPIPPGWKEYPGWPSVFHCGFRGMVADCDPDSDHRQGEVFYNEAGKRVDDKDIDYRCAGSPNADDPSEGPLHFIRHIVTAGGIIQDGWGGFVGTVLHGDRQLPKFPPR